MQFCIINGSPRGKSGNTQIMLEKVVSGFLEVHPAELNWF